MDDLVVIILTLIIVVIGAIGQIKKNKNVQPAKDPGTVPVNFWDLIETQETPQVVTEHEVFDPVHDNSREEEIENYESVYESLNENEKKTEYKFDGKNEGISAFDNDITTIEPLKNVTSKKRMNFSLREAVIYSEILNRKYT